MILKARVSYFVDETYSLSFTRVTMGRVLN